MILLYSNSVKDYEVNTIILKLKEIGMVYSLIKYKNKGSKLKLIFQINLIHLYFLTN